MSKFKDNLSAALALKCVEAKNQTENAQKLGVAQSMFSRYKSGDAIPRKDETYTKMETELGLTFSVLVDGSFSEALSADGFDVHRDNGTLVAVKGGKMCVCKEYDENPQV